MPEQNLSCLVRSLADPDDTVREQSAADIFRRGSEVVAPLLCQWLSDPQLGRYLVTDSGSPQITVGVAVEPLNFEQIRAANGSPRLASVPPDQDATEFELELGRGVRLDILSSTDPKGPGAIARFLQKFGEGIQQIEVNVNDVDEATETLRARFGIQAVYPATRAGANGTRVNFFLAPVPSGGKVLIELVQTSPAASA